MTYTDYENSHDKRIIFTENQLSEWKDALNEATTETQKAKAERNIIKIEEELERLNKEKEIISLLEINNSQWEKVLDDPGMSDETRNLATDAINQNNKDIAEWQNQKEQLQKAKEKVEPLQ